MTYKALRNCTNALTRRMTQFGLLLSLAAVPQVAGCKDDPPVPATAPNTKTDALTSPQAAADGQQGTVDIAQVRTAIGAINARRWEEAAAIYHKNVTWSPGGHPEAKPLAGKAAVVDVWSDLAQWIPDLTVRPTRIIHAGDRMIVESWTGGTSGPSVRSLGLEKGAEVGVRSAEVLVLKEGLVAEVTAYGDGAAVRSQMRRSGKVASRPPADVAAKVFRGATKSPSAEFLEAEGLDGADWATGVPGVWVVAKGTSLWVITIDPAGSVSSRVEYSSVL